MSDHDSTKLSADTGPQGRLEALISRTTMDDVDRVKRRANLILGTKLGERMHPLTEGDIWACITAIREIAHTG